MTDKLQRAVSHLNFHELLQKHTSMWHLYTFHAVITRAKPLTLWTFLHLDFKKQLKGQVDKAVHDQG